MRILLRAVVVLGLVGGFTWWILTYEPCLSPVDAAEVDGQAAAVYRVRYRRTLLVWNGQPILFDGLGVDEEPYLIDAEPVLQRGLLFVWRLADLGPGDRRLGPRTRPYEVRIREHETILRHHAGDDAAVVRELVLDHAEGAIKKLESRAPAE